MQQMWNWETVWTKNFNNGRLQDRGNLSKYFLFIDTDSFGQATVHDKTYKKDSRPL